MGGGLVVAALVVTEEEGVLTHRNEDVNQTLVIKKGNTNISVLTLNLLNQGRCINI